MITGATVTLSQHEAWVQEKPDYYTASAFLGRGQYDTRRAETPDQACEIARELFAGRPVLVYAIRGVHQSVMYLIKSKTDRPERVKP